MANSELHRTVEAIWRIESARLIAGLARMLLDRAAACARASGPSS